MKKYCFHTLTNIVSLFVSIFGIIVALFSKNTPIQPIDLLRYFTLFTALLIAVVSLLNITANLVCSIKLTKGIVVNKPKWLYTLDLMTAVSALIVFLVVVCYLQWQTNDMTKAVAVNVTLHYVAPLSFVIGFIMFDIDAKRHPCLAFFGIVPVLVYGIYTYILVLTKVWNAPYPFLKPGENVAVQYLVVALIILGGGLVLSFALWLLNRLFCALLAGNEEKQEITDEEEELAKVIKVEKKEIEEVQEIERAYTGPRVYHISRRREEKCWQVKFANGQKAIKLFPTQAEAIVYAKKLAVSQNGSIRVHSMKGMIRKA